MSGISSAHLLDLEAEVSPIDGLASDGGPEQNELESLRRRCAELETQVKQLTEALDTRDLIGQAMGILIERDAVSPEEALNQLKSASQHSNVRLHQIAREVVDRAVQRPKVTD